MPHARSGPPPRIDGATDERPREYPQPVAMRNSTGWTTGGRKRARTSGLRRYGINLIMLGAFALVAAGAASVVVSADLPMDTLMLIGIVMCLAGWRMLVIARRREHSSD
jgi:uncharacterized membrane protein